MFHLFVLCTESDLVDNLASVKMQSLDNGYENHNGVDMMEDQPTTEVEQQINEVIKVPFNNYIYK